MPHRATGPAAHVERLRAAMSARGIHALVLTEPANVRYATGIAADVLWSSPTRTIAVVVPRDGDPLLVCPGFIADEAAAVSGWPVDRWDRIDAHPVGPVAEHVRRLTASAGPAPVVGLEREGEARTGMSPATLDSLEAAILAALPGARLVDGMGAAFAARLVKDADEIEALARACAASSAGFAAAYGAPRTGESEQAVARAIMAGGIAASAAWPAWTVPGWIAMTSGRGHYTRFVERPRTRRIEHGDLLWADVGFRTDGYWSDLCRAAVAGGPTARQADRQRRILAATAAGVAMARPGVRASEVARAVMAAVEREGLPSLGFGRLGHGIGLTATEPPSIVIGDETVLEAGMAITVEPAAVFDDGLYCAEQVVIVGEEPRVLSLAPGELGTI